jgi:hypothetical protein
MSHDIEPTFSRYFLPIFRNEANVIRQDPNCRVDNFGRISHLQIQFGNQAGPQPKDILVLNVPPIGSEMNGNTARASAFANGCGRDEVGLTVRRVAHSHVTRLAQCCDVINIYT